MKSPTSSLDLESGPFPKADGWSGLYRTFAVVAPTGSQRRRAVCRYFWPTAVERRRGGLIFRALGVHLFGAVIPTGGAVIRRLTGARMAPYTLRGTSRTAAREFYYRACVFEALHLPFFLALAALALHRLVNGRPDLALENTLINLLVNGYPMLHHRRTRLRIVRLLERAQGRLCASRAFEGGERPQPG